MENEVLLKALEKLFDEKLKPIKDDIAELKSDVDEIKATQQIILTFIKEVDKEFYKVEETYKFMNDLKSVLSR